VRLIPWAALDVPPRPSRGGGCAPCGQRRQRLSL